MKPSRWPAMPLGLSMRICRQRLSLGPRNLTGACDKSDQSHRYNCSDVPAAMVHDRSSAFNGIAVPNQSILSLNLISGARTLFSYRTPILDRVVAPGCPSVKAPRGVYDGRWFRIGNFSGSRLGQSRGSALLHAGTCIRTSSPACDGIRSDDTRFVGNGRHSCIPDDLACSSLGGGHTERRHDRFHCTARPLCRGASL
jgi:hypothetical protein